MASNNIPLHCNICPKKPNFSDVSHLLTHVSSKGHLSNYYKVKVRSTNEDASRRLVDAYDRWYTDWNVEELMSDRMNQKDKRRTRARPAGTAPQPRPARRAAAGSFLDPRLAEQQVIKLEHSVTPTPPPYQGPVLRQRTFAPHMQYWATESRASSRSYTNPDYETSSEYSDPGERKAYRYPVATTCSIEDDDPTEVVENTMAVSECTKLKGVYWPGMDIFDSATPEMRRKRNQKKDSSVVAQLELNSQEVEATELIFTPQGSFKRQRRMSSSVYDDEEEIEIKTESPRPSLSRPALVDMDVNAARRPRQLTRSQMYPFVARNQYNEDRGRSGYGYSYGDRASKRKHTFDVFQDEEEVSFSQPASFNYLTSAFTHQTSPSPLPTFAPCKPLNDQFQYDNKENALPLFHQQTYGNPHNPHANSYHYHAYTYGLGQDQRVFPFNHQLYNGDNVYEQQTLDDDDQRTITAPPSPATS
ncbi:hypothetical protein P153DRAFT_330604 [Dothidotthia symphoricarpi CBS 119687]|uniref:Uncharacterized protein n=1 Tax=Dothidotthia symphoricarpi CBS 119687 TaxID=1392245 RepID=A0A6A6ASI1_9PLEO|nr:uncharacterized protein P153DRAFT_330604 [Dothidotthia symphoricarpi CBS 119687]KAF2133945.1 hypothetical protein P153DRAFT_330604 [Dothidotthia symphoricarpi CBS 119687]